MCVSLRVLICLGRKLPADLKNGLRENTLRSAALSSIPSLFEAR